MEINTELFQVIRLMMRKLNWLKKHKKTGLKVERMLLRSRKRLVI
ncbi:hypothetical protein FAEPRAM212_01718 [Faecalibacterium prausnitzii M21/2]|uniref:Uncharacterized protein n=1 Tax=Faecalibacterium prausnitzii M21/2 TaxID=411485 RepID=A8SBN5_9FIRM|nr:hypothetical protein FAEPRAM212_01718 [Faecalibacterium prausnitzii M21/2]